MDRLESIAGYFILLGGWKRFFAALVFGALSALSMPPFDFFPILFITFPVFVFLLDSAATESPGSIIGRFGPSFRVGWGFGFAYFLASMWWVGNAFLVDADGFGWLLPVAVIALPLLLGFFWGVGAAISRLFWGEGPMRILALAASLGLAEYLRGTLFTGLPWNAIGYATMTGPIGFQSASLVGLYGISVFAVLVFSAPALLMVATKFRLARSFVVLIAIGLGLGHLGYGYYRLDRAQVENVAGVNLRLMQPNIDQAEKWEDGQDTEILTKYLQLSTRATSPTKSGLSGTTHLIWPESAFPFILTERRDALSAISAMLPEGTSLITGAMRREAAAPGQTKDRFFNSIYVIDPNGETSAAVDKVHLVPFGEYLPLQEFAESMGFRQLTNLRGGFDAGNNRTLLNTGTGPAFHGLICYEIIFPGQIDTVDGRGGWILNLTNDAWFGNTPGPHQHMRQALIRGVEEGLPVVRVANSGISFVSDAFGRVRDMIPLNSEGVSDQPLPEATAPTPFAIYKHLPFFGILALLFLFSALGIRRA